MVKKRPAVVISPRLPHRDGLCSVVPLSGTASGRELQYQCRLELAEPLPEPFPQHIWWAKCDMLATVGFKRLDLFRTERQSNGQRKYLHPKVSVEQFEEIREAVLFALGMGHLTSRS